MARGWGQSRTLFPFFLAFALLFSRLVFNPVLVIDFSFQFSVLTGS
jgi:hypothetical protein